MNQITQELNRQNYINNRLKIIEDGFLNSLRDYNFDVCPYAVCKVNKHSIELGIADTERKGYKMAFASDIQLYLAETDEIFGRPKNEINFGCSGSFTPIVQESYWRTIHAASILKKWELAFEIAKKHCKMYADLENEIRQLKNAK